jgi:hypothetical protein
MTYHFVTPAGTLIVFVSGGGWLPSDYLLPELKQTFGGHITKTDREVDTFVALRLITQGTVRHQHGTEQLSPRYGKCLTFGGDFYEKLSDSSPLTCELFLFDLKIGPQTTHTVNVFSDQSTYQTISFELIHLLKCNWVATRWQQFSTHLHTNNTQNNTKVFGRVRAVHRL